MNGRRVVAGLVVAVLLVGGVAYSTAKGSEKSSTLRSSSASPAAVG